MNVLPPRRRGSQPAILVLGAAAFLLLPACGEKEAPVASGPPRVLQPEVDMGDLPHGATGRARFVLVHGEGRPVLIRQVVVSCLCAYLRLSARGRDGSIREAEVGPRLGIREVLLLQPGEQAEAEVRYETGETPPLKVELKEPVQFYLDHPEVKRIDCRLRGRVLPRLRFQPPLPSFGEFSEAERPSLVVDLEPLPGAPPVRVKEFQGTHEKLVAEVLDTGPERTRVRFQAGPGLLPGPFLANVRVLTDVGGGYSLPLLLRGTVVPRLAMEPPPPMALGALGAGREFASSLLLAWRVPGSRLALRVEACRGPEFLRAVLEEDEPGRRWRLTLRGCPPAGTEGALAGEVILATGAGELPAVAIPFHGLVERRP